MSTKYTRNSFWVYSGTGGVVENWDDVKKGIFGDSGEDRTA